MTNIRDLEDLIIDAIYQEVISGKLDQKEQQFDVEYTMGRDVEASTIEGMLASVNLVQPLTMITATEKHHVRTRRLADERDL